MERIETTSAALFVMAEVARRNFESPRQRVSAVTAAFLSLAGVPYATEGITREIRKELAKC